MMAIKPTRSAAPSTNIIFLFAVYAKTEKYLLKEHFKMKIEIGVSYLTKENGTAVPIRAEGDFIRVWHEWDDTTYLHTPDGKILEGRNDGYAPYDLSMVKPT